VAAVEEDRGVGSLEASAMISGKAGGKAGHSSASFAEGLWCPRDRAQHQSTEVQTLAWAGAPGRPAPQDVCEKPS